MFVFSQVGEGGYENGEALAGVSAAGEGGVGDAVNESLIISCVRLSLSDPKLGNMSSLSASGLESIAV